MRNMPEKQISDQFDLLKFVESRDLPSDCRDDEMTIRSRASLLSSAAMLGLAEGGCLSLAELLEAWVGCMISSRLSSATRRRYLGRIRSLCTSAVPAVAADSFASAFQQARNASDNPAFSPVAVNEATLSATERLIAEASPDAPLSSLAAALMFYGGALPASSLVDLTFDSCGILPTIPAASALISELRAPRRRYILPLGQGKKRAARIASELEATVAARIIGLGGTPGLYGGAASLIAGAWLDAAAALPGVSLPEVRAAYGESRPLPPSHRWLALIPCVALTPGRRSAILAAVAASRRSPLIQAWFVMRLRPAVTPDDIETRLAGDNPALLSALTTYYPRREAARRVNRKIVKYSEPYMPGFLFFRMRRDMVGPLFAIIGDLAWCFRQGPGRPYAEIPAREMERFQRFIGIYTPDIEIDIHDGDDSPAFGIGDTVSVTGGVMTGYEGEIVGRESDAPDGTRVYILHISCYGSIRMTARIDSRNLALGQKSE